MKTRKLILTLLIMALAVLVVGCDGRDGNTSGSAESNGVISDVSRETSKKPDTSRTPDQTVSDAISDGKQDLSDVLSDIESGAGDLISDTEEAVSDLVDGK